MTDIRQPVEHTTVYLAGRYGRRAELAGYGKALERLGLRVQARWLTDRHELIEAAGLTPDEAVAKYAWAFGREDYEDVLVCDVLVAFMDEAGYEPVGYPSGARFVEFGIALARETPIVIVGQPQSVFHWWAIHESRALQADLPPGLSVDAEAALIARWISMAQRRPLRRSLV